MVISKITSLGEGRQLKRLEGIVEVVNTFEPELEDLSDGELRAKTAEFKARLADGEALDDVLPEAFACVREAARRSIGQRHFDVQVQGAIVLHRGDIAEMKTGEGKTLVATMPVYLNALEGKGVHVVTVKPGFVATRMTEGMDLPKALTAEPAEVATAVLAAVARRHDVVYVRRAWWPIMTVIRLIPERVFKRMRI